MIIKEQAINEQLEKQQEMLKEAAKKEKEYQGGAYYGSCPNCGYCKHCGRSNHTPTYPYYPYPYWFNTTSGSTRSISATIL